MMDGDLRRLVEAGDLGAAVCSCRSNPGLRTQLLLRLGLEDNGRQHSLVKDADADVLELAERGLLPAWMKLHCAEVADWMAVFFLLLGGLPRITSKEVVDGLCQIIRDAACMKPGIFLGASLAFLDDSRKSRYVTWQVARGRSASDRQDLLQAAGCGPGHDWEWEEPVTLDSLLGEGGWGDLYEEAHEAVAEPSEPAASTNFVCCACQQKGLLSPEATPEKGQPSQVSNVCRAGGCARVACDRRHWLQDPLPPTCKGGLFAEDDEDPFQ